MKKLILITVLTLGFSMSISAQCPTTMPAGTLCITQEAGNKAAENARLIPVLEEKIKVFETIVIPEKDKSIAEIKETAAKNEAALKEQNTKLLTDIAAKTGQLITYEKIFTRDSAWFEYLIKTSKGKQNGLINIKFGSN